MNNSKEFWKKCSNCKKEISYGSVFQLCSISSCKKWAFCSVDCWSIHDSVMGHKSAWAEERKAPLYVEEHSNEKKPKRILVSSSKKLNVATNSDLPKDILIVASKLKNYIKLKHGLNTSANVMERLSDIVRNLSDDAVSRAQSEGRKTLMDRDFL